MPQLDVGFQVFLNWQTAIFMCGIYLVTYFVRNIVEKMIWPNALSNRYYNDLALHLAPLIFGALIALLAKKFPWPMPIADVTSAKLMYGGICGAFCGLFYGRLRAFLGGGADATEDPPAATAGAVKATSTPPPAKK